MELILAVLIYFGGVNTTTDQGITDDSYYHNGRAIIIPDTEENM